jgi:hypothetical protein
MKRIIINNQEFKASDFKTLKRVIERLGGYGHRPAVIFSGLATLYEKVYEISLYVEFNQGNGEMTVRRISGDRPDKIFSEEQLVSV